MYPGPAAYGQPGTYGVPGVARPLAFPSHPFSRGPRDFFMMGDE
jgi:hypothetical protein